MSKRTPRKKRSFFYTMLSYAVYFLCFCTIGLIVLFRFLHEYEMSQPNIAIDAYMEALSTDRICEYEKNNISTLDRNVQTEEETLEFVREYLRLGVHEIKDSAASTENRIVYALTCRNTVVGHVYLEKGEVTALNLRPWHVSGEDFDFSFLQGQPVSVTVPDTYSVMCNGRTLGSQYIVEKDIPIESLKDFYSVVEGLPHLCTYTVDNYYSEAELTVLDETGTATTYSEEKYAAACLDEICPKETVEKLTAFIEEFIDKYVAYTGSSKYNYQENYKALEPYMVPGSDIQTRTYNAMDSFAFGGARDNIITEIDVNHCFPQNDGHYLCYLTYYVNVRGGDSQYTLTENTAKLVITETEDGYKAVEMPEKTTSTVDR